MFTVLINCSNLKKGGGIQVAQSICDQLRNHTRCHFVVVLSTFINIQQIHFGENVEVFFHNIKHNLNSIAFGRDRFMDSLVINKGVQAVLTVFGPSIWRPKVPHLCGFARAQLLLDNPSQNRISLRDRLIYRIWTWSFKRSSNAFYTENKYISDLLPALLGRVKVYTVTNYYNQVFDTPEKWNRSIALPPFDGVTCLSVSSPYPHKNFGILDGMIRYLRITHPEFKVRFVLTFSPEEWPMAKDVQDCIVYVGKIDVSECPFLYEQADIMFMPSLQECFTATYPEAMRMSVPIVTPDLAFARGLCGNAACYYSAIDPQAAAEAIYKVATDKEYSEQLSALGRKQLKRFDDYEQRTVKLLEILEGQM